VQGSVPKVLFCLRGHTDRVNAVQWINDSTLVSVSSDKSWIVWAFVEGKDPRDPESWNFMRRYAEAHDLAINYLRTYSPTEGELYVLTMCVGGTLKLWQGTNLENIEYREKLLFGKNLQEALGLIAIGDKHLMLAIGGYDINIHIYLIPRIQHQSADQKIFKYKFSLLGHMNSMRYFAFSPVLDKQIFYMASCSQDSYIRLWKV